MNFLRKTAVLSAMLLAACAAANAQGLTADQKRQLDVTQRNQRLKAKGGTPLYFFDAETAEPLRNVRVRLPDGTEFTSDRHGFATLPKMEDGEHELVFSADGYVEEEGELKVRAGFATNYRFAMSKKLLGRKFRIVLTWGERPGDLDLHLEKEGGYHISYRDMTTADDGSANLDRDDVTSFGPETITVSETAAGTNYFVYVVDYTNHGDASQRELSRSGASVKVYGEDGLLAEYAVPTGPRGNRWNVCTIKDGRLSANGTVVPNY